MNIVTYLYPAPWSPLPLHHPARAYVPADQTTPEHLAEVFRQHAPILARDIVDDYDLTERSAHLDLMGEFA